MRTITLMPLTARPATAWFRHWPLFLAIAGLINLASPNLQAQPMVATIGGGSTSKPYSGYINGNTLTQAKYSMPAGMAVDRTGSFLYLADYTNNAVRLISQAGNTAASITSTFADSNNGVSHPLAVVVDVATNVYVLNRGTGANGSVIRFAGASGIAGASATLASSLANAAAMVMDPAGNLYIAAGNKVIRIGTNGVSSTLGTISTAGTSLQGIAWLPSGQLAVADAVNNGILLMNATNGATTTLTGFHGSGDILGGSNVAAFHTPETLSASGSGTLVVADNGNNKVKLVDTSGTVSLLYGVSSSLWVTGTGTFPGWADGPGGATQGDAESRLPYGVVVSYDGSVFVSEDYYHVLRHVTSTGLTSPLVPGSGVSGGGGSGATAQPFSTPEGLAYDGTGNLLYAANTGNNTVEVIDLLATTNPTSIFLASSDGLLSPVALLVDGDENLYVLNQAPSGNGSVLEFDKYADSYGPIVNGLNQPTAFTMDSYGNIFVTEQSGKIKAFGTGVSNTVVTITNAGVSLQGIAMFDDGTLAVSDAGNQVIWTVNPITKVISKLTGQLGASGLNVGTNKFARFNQPHQMTRAGGNQLLVADYGNNRLVSVQRNGTTSTNLLNSLKAQIWFGSITDPSGTNSTKFVPMVSPVGVAVGGGMVFASETHYSDVRGLLNTTLTGPSTNPGFPLPTYSNPSGIALNAESTALYSVSTTNNTLSVLDLVNNQTSVFLDSSSGLNQPVDVAVDNSDNVYVLNRGNGSNGFVLEFDLYGNFLGTNVTGLSQPTALTVDSSGDLFITGLAGTVSQVLSGANTNIPLATVTNAGVQLQGIALFSDGTIAVSDSGNHVIWQIDPVTHVPSVLTGRLGSPGTNFGSSAFAKLNQPHHLELAAGDLLVTADTGNNRVVTVDRFGSITNALNSTNAIIWYGLSTDPVANSNPDFIPMLSPIGVAIGKSGGVFASENYYNDIREMLATSIGQSGPGGSSGGGGGSGTNVYVAPPTITPNAGYYPMGQNILVQSSLPGVYYTTDGSVPTTNSLPVSIVGNVGYIHWFNSTNDLTWLRLKTFATGTNASAVIQGQSFTSANIGIPRDFNPSLQAGIGSSIVVPVVCNLNTNQQVQSFQFRLEISPLNNLNTPELTALSIDPTNDFVPLVTVAESGQVATYSAVPYTLGDTNGLEIYAVGDGNNVLFHHYAVMALVEVQIPFNANVGDTYSINVLFPSATSDAYNTPVPLTTMPPATIVVTNIPYTVGDSASGGGAWYNAGTFGDDNLDNSDVNQAFDAASGLRLPYSFSDVFNAMDAYPPDAPGFVGGDGQIRFLDWMTILERSLRLDPSDWSRVWSGGGILTDFSTNLVVPHSLAAPLTKLSPSVNSAAPWYRQVLLGANSVGNAAPGSTVYVPVYAKLSDGASLSGLQFRTLVTPQNGAPPLSVSPQLALAPGVTSPLFSQSFKAGESAFGWSLGSFNCQSRSSNFLGWVTFTLPTNAATGQTYQVSLLNADGAPNLTNQYDFETRSATVTVNAAAPTASICSDEWKIHFFGSTTNPAAADNADPDGDGVPNWMEFLAGTDPTSAASKLQMTCAPGTAGKFQRQMNLNWVTAPGRAYALQWSSSLTSTNWQTLGNISGNGFATNCPDINPPTSARYYRLSVLP